MYYLAQMCFEMSLLDASMITTVLSLRAAAALQLSMSLLKRRNEGEDEDPLRRKLVWNQELEIVSGYLSEDVKPVAREMMEFLMKNKDNEKMKGLVAKFKLKEYGSIALVELNE